MSGRYIAKVYNRYGAAVESPESADLQTAIDAAVAAQGNSRDAMIMVVNLDEVDIDRHDGLMREERSTVENALNDAWGQS
jgi:hypothetical protein